MFTNNHLLKCWCVCVSVCVCVCVCVCGNYFRVSGLWHTSHAWGRGFKRQTCDVSSGSFQLASKGRDIGPPGKYVQFPGTSALLGPQPKHSVSWGPLLQRFFGPPHWKWKLFGACLVGYLQEQTSVRTGSLQCGTNLCGMCRLHQFVLWEKHTALGGSLAALPCQVPPRAWFGRTAASLKWGSSTKLGPTWSLTW